MGVTPKLEFRSRYWGDHRARGAFKAFVLEIHGLNLTEWEEAGYWDDRYTPFSYFLGDRVVASVCIYLLDAVVEGEATRLVQISGVGTDPDFRRRGLNRELTELGLEWARGRHSGVFLFADEGAIPYYERCGFEARTEYVARAPLPPYAARPGAVMLDPGDESDRAKLYELAQRRAPVSERLSLGSPELVLFHALGPLRRHAFEIPELGCVVFCERNGSLLRILDVVGETIPPLDKLGPFLVKPGDEEVELCFFPDRLEVEEVRFEPLRGNHCFTRGDFPVPRPVFPATARA
jgi:predicted N-acetyltransferase YhbS